MGTINKTHWKQAIKSQVQFDALGFNSASLCADFPLIMCGKKQAC
jgi:hypothetical protein